MKSTEKNVLERKMLCKAQRKFDNCSENCHMKPLPSQYWIKNNTDGDIVGYIKEVIRKCYHSKQSIFAKEILKYRSPSSISDALNKSDTHYKQYRGTITEEKCEILANVIKLPEYEKKVLIKLMEYTYLSKVITIDKKYNVKKIVRNSALKEELNEAIAVCSRQLNNIDNNIIIYCKLIQKKFQNVYLFGYGEKSNIIDKSISKNKMTNINHGFIPMYMSDWKDEEESLNPERLDIHNLFFNNCVQKRFLVRGRPGSGKTTLLRYLCYHFAQQFINQGKDYIPVYIRLRDYRDRDDQGRVSIEELINRTFKVYIEDYDLLNVIKNQNLLKKNKLAVILDGIDEIKDEETGKNFMNIVDDFVIRNPHCRIILTSRSINLKKENYPKFRALDINPLTENMYTEYIKKWFSGRDEKTTALLHILKTKPRISELVGNPFLLSMICFTFDTEATRMIEHRSELYKACTEELLKRSYDNYEEKASFQDMQHGNDKLSSNQIIETLKDISFFFFQWQEEHFIDDYVTIMGMCNHRSGNQKNTVQLFENLEKETGIIQRTEKGFTFIHRSLWEYFTALALLDKNLNAVIHQGANPKWEEIIRLYAGLLDHEQQKEKLNDLIKGIWTINRPLALRVTTEVNISAYDLIKPLIDREDGNKSKLLLVDSVEQSLPLIEKTQHETLVNETLRILLIECKERDCEVIYYCHKLLERLNLKPLEKRGLIYELLDLDNAQIRQEDLLKEPENFFQMIEITGGSFLMGDNKGETDEHPEHLVLINTFYLTKHPVTNRMMNKANFPFGNRHPKYGGGNNPAVGNTWFEAYYFALWLGARLPTEAEWEYAARGGEGSEHTNYFFGNNEKELCNHAWFGDAGRRESHPVNEINPLTGKENLNHLNLANILGNVREWCNDWYNENYYKQCKKRGTVLNPTGPKKGDVRVLRGGSWNFNAAYCRSAYRSWNYPGICDTYLGFRLALDHIENSGRISKR